MGMRDLIKRTRAKHGGLRKAARAAMRGGEEGSSGTKREARGPLPEGVDGAKAVAWSEELPEGRSLQKVVGEDAVAIFRVDGSLYAIDNACVHEDGPLGEGTVEGLVVTCPYHDWRFSLDSGECLSHENRAVACYRVFEQQGAIFVGKRTSEGSAERGGAHDDGLEVLVRSADD